MVDYINNNLKNKSDTNPEIDLSILSRLLVPFSEEKEFFYFLVHFLF